MVIPRHVSMLWVRCKSQVSFWCGTSMGMHTCHSIALLLSYVLITHTPSTTPWLHSLPLSSSSWYATVNTVYFNNQLRLTFSPVWALWYYRPSCLLGRAMFRLMWSFWPSEIWISVNFEMKLSKFLKKLIIKKGILPTVKSLE